MKIISKHKDYYDYLANIYGVDDKVVYERKYHICVLDNQRTSIINKTAAALYTPNFIRYSEAYKGRAVEFALHICGKKYDVVFFENNFYYEPISKSDYKHIKENAINFKSLKIRLKEKPFFHFLRKKEIDYNKIFECPIVFHECGNTFHLNVKLSDFNFAAIMPPEKIYQNIVAFLSKEPDIVDKRTDIEKIEAHGFDKKISFRKRK